MEESIESLTIKSWAEEDRPREKLLLKGKGALSDAELITILLRTGVKGSSALDIAKKILHRVNGDLNELGKLSANELKKMEKGLGETKAITIVAALELGRRRRETGAREKPVIKESQDTFNYIYPILADQPQEQFHMLYLNKANRVVAHKHISSGGISGTIADIKIILKHGIELLASSMVAVHNHPSGNIQPSQSDIDLTRKLKEGSKLLEILLFDHLIIGDKNYFSFADKGML